jgi:TolA-binding protein
MTHRALGVALGVILLAAASPAAAANKEHQQMMADLRMLQEQSQLLQNLIGSVTDALKAVNARLDQQTETNRKAFADQQLTINNLTNDVRIIREKLDDNNVRIGSLTQEVDSLRQSMRQMSARPSGISEPTDASSPDAGVAAGSSPSAGQPSPVGVSPQKLLDTAQADYSAGQYDLAILGFTDYIKSFPKSDKADDAQVWICASYIQDKKYEKAAEACDLAIRNYPTGDKIPEAYYRKGLALSNLKDINGARDAFEHAVKMDPDGAVGGLAKQGLERLKRP